MLRIVPVLLVIVFAASLPACGKRGPLVLPPADDSPTRSNTDKTD